MARFAEAEALQAERQPEYPLLYSLQGFQYCDLLLAGAERAAWVAMGENVGWADAGKSMLGDCAAVAERAARVLPIAERKNRLLDIALGHLTLVRCALYTALLQGQPPDVFEVARKETEQAVAGLHASGQQNYLPLGLLTRARLFPDENPQNELAQARALIEQCEYFRRLPELEDAERALAS